MVISSKKLRKSVTAVSERSTARSLSNYKDIPPMGCFPEPYPRDGFFAQWDKSSGKERSSQCAVTLSQIRKPVPENQKESKRSRNLPQKNMGSPPFFTAENI